MIRDHKPEAERTWSTWPILFWRRCRGCKLEFRREWGWRINARPFGGTRPFEYVCGRCAATAADAQRIADDPGPPPPFPHNWDVASIPMMHVEPAERDCPNRGPS